MKPCCHIGNNDSFYLASRRVTLVSPLAKNRKHIDVIKVLLSNLLFFAKFSTLVTSPHVFRMSCRLRFTFPPSILYLFIYFPALVLLLLSARRLRASSISDVQTVGLQGRKNGEAAQLGDACTSDNYAEAGWGAVGACGATDGQTETELIYMLTESSSSQQPSPDKHLTSSPLFFSLPR